MTADRAENPSVLPDFPNLTEIDAAPWELVVVGGGPAGLAAAISAFDAGLRRVLVLEREKELGGILNQCVHNGFGLHRFNEELTGPEYAGRFVDALKERKIPFALEATVLRVDRNGENARDAQINEISETGKNGEQAQNGKTGKNSEQAQNGETGKNGEQAQTAQNGETGRTGVRASAAPLTVAFASPTLGFRLVSAKSVVLATGCRERTRGAIGVPGARPSGVFTAGAAQRYVNREGERIGRRVVILGSGDIGLIMARRLTLEGAKVLAVVELMPYSNGLTRNIVQCLRDFDIPLYLSHTVVRVDGARRLEKVVVAEVDAKRTPIPGTEIEFDCDALLLSVGLIPENELARETGVEIDRRTNGPVVSQTRETSIPGVFSCGNALHVHDLVDFVSEESEEAGRAAAAFVLGAANEPAAASDAASGAKSPRRLTVRNGRNVNYVVPQRLDLDALGEKTSFFLRVSNVFANKKLVVRRVPANGETSGETSGAPNDASAAAPGEIVKIVKRPRVAPAEMERITLSREELANFNDGDAATISLED